MGGKYLLQFSGVSFRARRINRSGSGAEGMNCYYPVLRAFKVLSVLSCRVAPNSLDNFIIWTDVTEDVSRMFHIYLWMYLKSVQLLLLTR